MSVRFRDAVVDGGLSGSLGAAGARRAPAPPELARVNVAAAFPGDLTTLARTRRFVGAVLEGSRATAEQMDAAVLVTNELATNAICHAGETDVVVRLCSTEETLRIEVQDHSPETPAVASEEPPPPWSGLAVVAAHCWRWGVDRTATGKRIWALIQIG